MFAFPVVYYKHIGINPFRISLCTFLRRECNLECFSTVSREVGHKGQFVHLAVSVQIVQLRWNFLCSFHDNSGFNFEAGVQLMQVDNNWSIRFGLIPVVLYFNCDGFLLFLRLGRQTENS